MSALEDSLAFQLKALGIDPPEREYRFDAVRRWRLDFYYPDARLGIEVHGGIYSSGRHTRGSGFEKDREKMNAAAEQGITVLEFTPMQIKSGYAAALVERMLEQRGRNDG